MNILNCKDKMLHKAGNLTTAWKKQFPAAFRHFPPSSDGYFFLYTFISCTTFDSKPRAELQKKKGYLLTVLLSACPEKTVSKKCCNYSNRVRSALCSFFKSKHCSGETFVSMAANTASAQCRRA